MLTFVNTYVIDSPYFTIGFYFYFKIGSYVHSIRHLHGRLLSIDIKTHVLQ